MVWYRTPITLFVQLFAAGEDACLLEIGSVLTRPFEASEASRQSAREKRSRRLAADEAAGIGLLSLPKNSETAQVMTVQKGGFMQWGTAVNEGSDPDPLVADPQAGGTNVTVAEDDTLAYEGIEG